MKKLSSTLPNMLLSLGLVSVLAAALLGGMYLITKEPIARIEKQNRIEAIRRVAPPFDNDPEADAVKVVTAKGDTCTVYPAKMGGRLQGAAVSTRSMEGFGGEMTIMAGFTLDGTVKDYQVLSHAETPGLGAKMQEWFRDSQGHRSVLGKNPGKTRFYVVKDKAQKGEIDGITAATISSRAFLGALRDAYEVYINYAQGQGAQASAKAAGADGQTGASPRHSQEPSKNSDR